MTSDAKGNSGHSTGDDAAKRRRRTVPAAPPPDDGPFAGPRPAPAFPALPRVAPGYARIVETIFHVPDPKAEFDLLKAELESTSLVAGETDGRSILAVAESRALRAHRLYCHAKLVLSRYQADCQPVEGAMRDAAIEELQNLKKDGKFSKVISEADVTAKAAQMFPDEWREVTDAVKKAELAIKHHEALASLWQSRCYTLNSLVGGRRAR